MEEDYTTFILATSSPKKLGYIKMGKKIWMYRNFFVVGEIILPVIVLSLSSVGTACCYIVRSWESSSVLPATTATVFCVR